MPESFLRVAAGPASWFAQFTVAAGILSASVSRAGTAAESGAGMKLGALSGVVAGMVEGVDVIGAGSVAALEGRLEGRLGQEAGGDSPRLGEVGLEVVDPQACWIARTHSCVSAAEFV